MIAATDINALVERHRPTALRVARTFAARLPPAVTFDDVVAACLEAVWRALDRCRGGADLDGDVEAYTFRAAVNAARKFVARERRRGVKHVPAGVRLCVANETPADEDGPRLADRAGVEDFGGGRPRWSASRWRAVLACVPPGHREVVIARILRERTVDAAAAEFGVSRRTVERRYSEAIAAIRAAHPELETELVTR